MSPAAKASTLFALVAAATATGGAIWFSWFVHLYSPVFVAASILVATGSSAGPVWRVARRANSRYLVVGGVRGSLIGVLSFLTSTFVVFCVFPLGRGYESPIGILGGALTMAVLGLIYFGWLTALIGAAAGAISERFFRAAG